MDESETRYFRRWSVRLRTGATEITAVGVIQTEEKEAILNTLVNVQKTEGMDNHGERQAYRVGPSLHQAQRV